MLTYGFYELVNRPVRQRRISFVIRVSTRGDVNLGAVG
jgi:hypothetical protein